MPHEPEPMKRCAECGRRFGLSFFRRNRALYAYSANGTHARCIGCEQTARDNNKASPEGRWREKIVGTIRRHARRLGHSVEILQDRYGWTVSNMLHDAQHAYKNGCPYCHRNFAAMGHGLNDVTLDIVDRDKAPFYVTNAKWVCPTCNKEKSTMTPEEWAARLANWALWNRPRTESAPRQLRLCYDYET